mgnify:CR=1 FL=1
MAIADITAPELRQILTYDPITGVFKRRNDPESKVGRIATKGYRQIMVSGKRYMAHRLAWLYIHGVWPDGQIDHINQVKDDNRIENLRVVTNKQNGENVSMFSHNTSGAKGVRFRSGSWLAEIRHHKKTQHLGSFETLEDAKAARAMAESILFTHSPGTQKITHIGGDALSMRHSIEAPGTKQE